MRHGDSVGAPNVNFRNTCCEISCLPTSPRIFEHLKSNGNKILDFDHYEKCRIKNKQIERKCITHENIQQYTSWKKLNEACK